MSEFEIGYMNLKSFSVLHRKLSKEEASIKKEKCYESEVTAEILNIWPKQLRIKAYVHI